VLKTLGEIASFAGSGSEMVMQFIVPPANLDGADRALVEGLAARAAEIGEPWLSFFEPGVLERHFKQIGFGRISHFGPDDAFERYMRCRMDGLTLPGYFGFIKAEVI
jgi:O-methyltransferase involved in polyketide biosynthesis